MLISLRANHSMHHCHRFFNEHKGRGKLIIQVCVFKMQYRNIIFIQAVYIRHKFTDKNCFYKNIIISALKASDEVVTIRAPKIETMKESKQF